MQISCVYRLIKTIETEPHRDSCVRALSNREFKSQQNQSYIDTTSLLVLRIKVRGHRLHVGAGSTIGGLRSDSELPASWNDRQRNLAKRTSSFILVYVSDHQDLLQDSRARCPDNYSPRSLRRAQRRLGKIFYGLRRENF